MFPSTSTFQKSQKQPSVIGTNAGIENGPGRCVVHRPGAFMLDLDHAARQLLLWCVSAPTMVAVHGNLFTHYKGTREAL